jgi:hypothetical protein
MNNRKKNNKGNKFGTPINSLKTIKEKDFKSLGFDTSQFQDTSPFVDYMMELGRYRELCCYIRYQAIMNKTPLEMYNGVLEEYKQYIGSYKLEYEEFMGWFFTGSYPELAKAFNFKKDILLGKLIDLGMKVAEQNTNSVKDGNFIMEFYDFINRIGTDLTVQKATTIINENNYSKQTINTISKLFAEASRFKTDD